MPTSKPTPTQAEKQTPRKAAGKDKGNGQAQVHAQATRGQKGPLDPDGPSGQKGPLDPDGPNGPNGPNGPSSPSGALGPNSSQGPKGVTAKKSAPIAKSSADAAATAIDAVDTTYLQTLLGYNARRAALSIIELFLERLAPYGLKPVDFSVMSTIGHNPGVTSRQLCATLNLLPPNLVGLIQSLEARGLIERKPHPHDGRAVGLHATPKGQALMQQAEQTAAELEIEKTAKLTPAQRKTLLALLQKIYL